MELDSAEDTPGQDEVDGKQYVITVDPSLFCIRRKQFKQRREASTPS
jgi:hypothetical protein